MTRAAKDSVKHMEDNPTQNPTSQPREEMKARNENTSRGHDEHTPPPLPHERDQSSLDQAGPLRDVIKQAKNDIVTGKKDTDLHGTPGLDKAPE